MRYATKRWAYNGNEANGFASACEGLILLLDTAQCCIQNFRYGDAFEGGNRYGERASRH
jgi:hypothetical protein